MDVLKFLCLFGFFVHCRALMFSAEFNRKLVIFVQESVKCHHVPGMTLSIVKGKLFGSNIYCKEFNSDILLH